MKIKGIQLLNIYEQQMKNPIFDVIDENEDDKEETITHNGDKTHHDRLEYI